MTMLSTVPREALGSVWPFVAGFATTIAETSRGRVNADHIREHVEKGSMQLWVVLGEAGEALALVVTEIITYPLAKVCVVRGLAGHERERWIHHLADIEAWAKDLGCGRMEVRGRKGMARVLRDYRLTSVYLEKELTDA
jgi:hypothetical protein